jgi:3-oxosteroid 1-dehydrogenase
MHRTDVDSTTDVIVVGAGAAGYSAAITAVTAGASVLLLEGSSAVGGTTARSGGSIWIPDNSRMRAAGLHDDREAAIRYTARLAFPHLYDPSGPTLGLPEEDYELIAVLYDRGSEALDLLLDLGAVHLRERVDADGAPMPPYPDYHTNLPENGGILGRALAAGIPDDADYPEVAARPGFHIGVGGRSLIATMSRAAVRLGVRVVTDRRVRSVIRDDAGRVTGVVADGPDGEERFGATGGVVFATGGFLMNRGMRHYLRGPIFGGSAAMTSQGDFVRIAGELGAAFGNMSQAWWDQTVLEQALDPDSERGTVAWPFGDSMIQVNKYGVRTLNEKAGYNERTQVHFVWDPTRLEYPNLLMFQIYDDAVASNPIRWAYRVVTPMPGEPAPHVISAATLEELADRIDARLSELESITGGLRLGPDFVASLRASIARFDGFAATGVDEDFGRGDQPLPRITNGPGRPGSPNPTMAPFAPEGPYHCIIMAAGALDTKGGPRIDRQGRVLATDGRPIPGLFGAGNCIAAPTGQTYMGAGTSLGSAITIGHVAGASAAREASTP